MSNADSHSARIAARPYNTFPLALLATVFAVGILVEDVANRFGGLSSSVWWTCGVVTALTAVWFVLKRQDMSATLSVLLAFAAAGATLAQAERSGLEVERVRRFYDDGLIASGEPVEITGVVEGATEPMPDGFSLRVRIERLRYRADERAASGHVRLFALITSSDSLAAYGRLELRHGARIRLMTRLRREEAFRNPGVESRVAILDRAGGDATGTIKSPLLVERLGDERIFLPVWWLYRWRAELLARVHKTFEPHTAGLFGAMLLGNEAFVTRDVGERFRVGGTYHVLVISGMQITVIGLVVFFFARRFASRPPIQFLVAASAVWGYALAVGAETSVVRAAVMFTFLALAPTLERPANSVNALGGAALLLLALQPSALLSPSFQLTFVSVLAITSLALPLLAKLKATGEWRPTAHTPYPPVASRLWITLAEMLYWDERGWQEEMRRSVWTYKLRKSRAAMRLNRARLQLPVRYVFAVIVVSAAVQVAMLPLLVVLFHRVSLVSLLLNVVTGALMALVSIGALVSLLVGELSTVLAAPFVQATEILSRFTAHSVDPFLKIGAASYRLPAHTGAGVSLYVLYYVALAPLVAALLCWRPVPRQALDDTASSVKRRSVIVAATCFVLLTTTTLVHPWGAEKAGGRLRVDFLDVGQGDAALVTMPCGATLLVDGGGRRASVDADKRGSEVEYDRSSIGEFVVSEYLWQRGLSRVDYVLATHADADHIEGLGAVARNFPARAAFVGRVLPNDPNYLSFTGELDARGVPLLTLEAGDTLRCGDARIEVLNPQPVSMGIAKRGNDDSVVLRVSYRDRHILLTGDIEQATEERLVAASRAHLTADVVKVAHHGSRTSSIEEFVGAVGARLAVISVGRDSPFGHPHAEVVSRWRESGARVLTTGEHGTISVSTDGDDLQVETFIGDSDR